MYNNITESLKWNTAEYIITDNNITFTSKTRYYEWIPQIPT